MKLNARTEYGLRVMVDLAQQAGEQTTLVEIARRQRVPVTMIPSIVQSLAKAGLTETARGHGGGVRLGKSAEDITVRDVLEALEHTLRIHRCTELQDNCPLGQGVDCSLRELWEETEAAVMNIWEHTTLADLVQQRARAVARCAEEKGANYGAL